MGSGLTIARTGKYKIFPLVGVVFIVVALVCLSFIVEADTSVWTLVPFMVLLGLGPRLQLAADHPGRAERRVPAGDRRGHVVGDVLPPDGRHDRDRRPSCRSCSPGSAPRSRTQIREAAQSNPDAAQQAAALQQAGADSVLADTSAIDAYPALVLPFRVGFSNSMDLVFLVAAAVVAVGFFVLWFLPQLELRNQSGIQAQQAAADDGCRRRPARRSSGRSRTQVAHAAGAAAPTSTAPPSGRPKDPPAEPHLITTH